jgi:hypothetical protein
MLGTIILPPDKGLTAHFQKQLRRGHPMGADGGTEFAQATLKRDIEILFIGRIVAIGQGFWISMVLEKLTLIDADLALNAVGRDHLKLLRQLRADR